MFSAKTPPSQKTNLQCEENFYSARKKCLVQRLPQAKKQFYSAKKILQCEKYFLMDLRFI